MWFLAGTGMVWGQSFTDLEVEAYWPLTADASDSLGAYGDLELVNVVGPGPDGIFLNGNYIYGDPDSSLAATPPINWDFDHLAVALEFKTVDSGAYRPIFICGDLYRWLGAQIAGDQLELIVNDIPVPSSAHVAPGMWHRVAVRWDAGTARLYLDGAEVATASADSLIHTDSDNDYRISNTHFGSAEAFKGYWRHLQVWSGQVATAVRHPQARVSLKVWPNPAREGMWVAFPATGKWRCRLIDPLGGVVRTYELEGNGPAFLPLDPGTLAPGWYVLVVTDGRGTYRTPVVLD